MTDDAGYTLAEALTALAIVALAMTGLTQAVRLTSAQVSTSTRLHERAADLAAIQHMLGASAQSEGPFDNINQRLLGDARHAAFACGEATCVLDLKASGRGFALSARGGGLTRTVPLGRYERPIFQYIAANGAVSGQWPDAGRPAQLAAIILTDRDTVLAVRRFRVTVDLSCAGTATRSCDPNRRDIP